MWRKICICIGIIIISYSIHPLNSYATVHEDLLDAVLYTDIQAAERALHAGADANITDRVGESVLHFAILTNQFEMVKLLLEYQANVEVRGNWKDATPLLYAASGGHLDIVKILLTYGADVKVQTYDGQTLVLAAAYFGQTAVLRYFKEYGLDLNEQNDEGRTALIEAVHGNKADTVQFLLEQGADVNATIMAGRNAGESALHFALFWGDVDIVQLLLEYGANPNLRNTRDGHPPLVEAVRADDRIAEAALLLEYGADVNATIAWGGHTNVTPLMFIVWTSRSPEIVQLLLAHGANTTIKTNQGKTALDLALEHDLAYRDIALIKIAHLLQQGNTTPDQDLLYAALVGDFSLAQRALDNGAWVNVQRAHDQWTALMLAAWWGHSRIVHLLLEHGADLSITTKDGQTVFDVVDTRKYSKAANQVEILYFLKHGIVSPNEALLYAAKMGDLQDIQQALNEGASIKAKTTHCYPPTCQTAIMLATQRGHLEMVQYLLANGISIRRPRVYEPFVLAITQKNFDLAEVFLRYGVDANQRLSNHRTLIGVHASASDMAVVKFLLAHGANIQDALDGAIAGRHPDIIHSLVEEYHADVTSALIGTVHNGDPEIIALLIEYGADVNILNIEGYTPLMEAARLGEYHVAKLLLEYGADPEVRSTNLIEEEMTALMFAAEEGYPMIVRLLLENGANTDVQNWDGETALILAAFHEHPDCVRLLLQYGANINVHTEDGTTALHYAIGNTSTALEIVMRLLEHNANVNAQDEDGNTPLRQAAMRGAARLTELLLQYGADIQIQNKNGQTPLICATFYAMLYAKERQQMQESSWGELREFLPSDYVGVIKLLLEHGVDVNAKRINGESALMFAAAWGEPKAVKLLLAYGANREFINESGQTALMIAQEHGHDEIVELLKTNSSIK